MTSFKVIPIHRAGLAAAVLLASLSTPAQALEGAYLAFTGGTNEANDYAGSSYDDGGMGALSLGYTTEYCLRPELELAVRQNDLDAAGSDASGDTGAVMANLWYDIPLGGAASRVKPYLGGGAGAVNVEYQDLPAGGGTVSGDTNVFAYQAGAGLGFDVTRKLGLSVGYRFLETSAEEFISQAGESRYRAQSAVAGLRYTFGEG